MTGTTLHQSPTPERFFNAINAYQQTEAMKAATLLKEKKMCIVEKAQCSVSIPMVDSKDEQTSGWRKNATRIDVNLGRLYGQMA